MTRRPLASRAHALARDLDRDLAGARARDLDRELDRDLAHALDHADALARALDHAHSLAAERIRSLAEDLVRVLARARNLACARTRARNLIRALDRALGRARALNRELGREPNRDLGQTRNLVQALVNLVRSRGAADDESGAGPAPGRVPRGLVAMAVQVLPMQDRDRYREEFRADLHELHRPRQQLGMALRVLTSALGLRRALTETPRNSDGTPARPAKR